MTFFNGSIRTLLLTGGGGGGGGAQGFQGRQGAQGAQGAAGNQGAQGSGAVAGATSDMQASLGTKTAGASTKFMPVDSTLPMPRLDQVGTPTADLGLNGFGFTNLRRALADLDALTLADALAQNVIELREDWGNGDPVGTNKWTAVVNGTGAAVTAVVTGSLLTAKNVGIVQLARGTVAGNRAGNFLGTSGASYTVGTDGQIYYYFLFQVPTVSDGTNTFRCTFGLGDTSAAGDQVNGVYCVVDTTITANIQLSTAASSTRTLVAGTTAVAGGTWVLARIKKANATTTFGLEVWVAGAWVDQSISISSNVPTVPMDLFIKLDGSVGTANRTIVFDFVHFRNSLPLGRT